MKQGKFNFNLGWERWKQRVTQVFRRRGLGGTGFDPRWRLLVAIFGFLLFLSIGWWIGRQISSPVASPPLQVEESGPAAETADLSAVVRELQQDLSLLRQRIAETNRPSQDGEEEEKPVSPIQWIPPVAGKVVRNSGWEKKGDEWRYHSGIDLAVPAGAKVLAAAAGKVVAIKTEGALGTVVTIDHGGDWRSLYGHLTGVQVTVGQDITQGAILGYSSPQSCGPEPGIHFNLYQQENPINPLAVISFPSE
ncbi:MAG TPA: M23 family metallopeptidase [Firmicutes bacterium]|nr:M23 family metallopeptidase [Bacillota bacterium]